MRANARRLVAQTMVLLVAVALFNARADAFEAFDGRLQAHGSFETQLRVISADFGEDWDVTQWYNVFYLELELDIAPDGVGPFDLISAYIGAEVRFDCIYSRGCGMFRGMNAFGDRAKSLPRRLSNATEQQATGQFLRQVTTGTVNGVQGVIYNTDDRLSGGSTDPVGFDRLAGFRGLLLGGGSDSQTGVPRGAAGFDPKLPSNPLARPTAGRCRDNQIDCSYFAGGTLQENGQGSVFDPSDPDFGTIYGELPTQNDVTTPLGIDDPSPYLLGDLGATFKFTQINVPGGSGSGNPIQILGPWLPKNFVNPNAALADRINPFDNFRDALAHNCPPGEVCDGYYTLSEAENGPLDPKNNMTQAPVWGTSDYVKNPNGRPIASPVLQSAAFNAAMSNRFLQQALTSETQRLVSLLCTPNGLTGAACDAEVAPLQAEFALAKVARQAQNRTFTVTGAGASAYAPIPLAAAGDINVANATARGLYLPSKGFKDALAQGKVNYYPFNIDETDRQWNRGAAQQQTKELKEAYLDMEFFDSALWVRLGKQNIVWGKTELFRTTDQFNPQDLALASLPSLEESRLGLWAFRGIYSLYEVGPLEDVRLELAFNFDQFQPADLGGCGEPYTVNIVCSLTFGALAHGAVGIGIAGIDRPDNPWESIKGWEGGVRVEFRWDQFTFAISDFYGFNDFPTIERISNFERNVDPLTGRPRVFGARGNCDLPTGAADTYYPDPDCLRPGPQYRLELRDDGVNAVTNERESPTLNVGIKGLVQPDNDIRQFDLSNQDIIDFPYLAPANNVPYFTKNDAFLADPADLRHRYADASDPLYQGAKFRAGLPTCTTNNNVTDNCVAPLYVAQFDPQNTTVGGSVTADDLYRPETAYSTANSLDASPVNLQFYNLACAATVGFSSLDPTACAVNIFSSRNFTQSTPSLQISRTLARIFGGYSQFAVLAGVPLAGTPPPLVQMWKDDLTVGSIPGGSRERLVSDFAGCFDINAINVQRPTGRLCDSDDPAEDRGVPVNNKNSTLNAVLTAEQEAILGCGPFFGNNCDSSGISLLWGELSAWVQSFPGIEGTVDLAGQGWRTDGLAAGSQTHVDLAPGQSLDDASLCTSASGKPDEGCTTLPDGQLFVSNRNSPYYGLNTDQVRLLFTPFVPNCSTWLGRTSPGVDCVIRYGQPGTIGARDIGFGTFDANGDFVPGKTAAHGTNNPGEFHNWAADSAPICTTATFGGEPGQVLPGCKTKWRNYQDEQQLYFTFPNGVQIRGQVLNLYGVDSECQDLPPQTRAQTFKCTHDKDGALLPGGQVYGGEYSPRADPRSWDVTRDGDPDYLGFDALANVGAANVDNLHPALAFRTKKRPGNVSNLGLNPANRCSYNQYRPVDQTNVFGAPGLGLPQCSRFQRAPDGSVAANAVVFPKGVGHPFTGQPWANELGAFSWNLFSLLVFSSASYDALKISAPNEIKDFPFTFRQPLAYATFDPNDPDNADRIAAIEDIQNNQPDTPTNRARIQKLRADMKPICSFITPKQCEAVGGILGLGGQGPRSVLAGGNGTFGRRTAAFQAGGEVLLSYQKRNVLGFGMDFAEDYTKSSWGVEWTWIPNVQFGDSNSFNGLNEADTFNLTISVDRPTFVNFLNANRTFFITSQWFFQYIDGYQKSYYAQGPYNILGIFLITTGYFQDRLLPSLLFVYDVQSTSGAATVSFTYRYSENFSISWGAALFMGRREFHPEALNSIGPPGNRLGEHAYEDSIEPGLSLIRDRDEVWMKLRYTF